MCLVSIIVPVYNGAAFLIQTLDAILKARCPDMEIIIVDDGSTDDSGKICRKYAAENKNILYEYKKNGGIVSSRNRGIELARGQYICFCDQDDLVNKDMYTQLLTNIKSNNCDVAMCGTSRLIGRRIVPAEVFENKVWKGNQIKEIVEAVLFNGTDLGRPVNERWVGTIWKCMIKKELIKENHIQFRRYVDYEDDLLFFLDVLTHAKAVCTIDYIGYNWRINLNSETYNWKYIPNYDEKTRNMINDIVQMLSLMGFEKKTIQNYENYQLCSMYEQLIINEGSKRNSKKFTQKISYIRDVLLKSDFERMIVFESHIRSTSIRKKVTIVLLRCKLWTLAYLWAVNYKKFREHAIKSSLWYCLEKCIKSSLGNY